MKTLKPLHAVFHDLPESKPGSDFRSRVLVRLGQEQARILSRRRRFSLVGLMFSLSILAVGMLQYGAPLLQSDFWAFSSLLFSDWQALAPSLQDFVFSLLETLPVGPLFALLAPLSLFLWSVSWLLSLSERQTAGRFQQSVLTQ